MLSVVIPCHNAAHKLNVLGRLPEGEIIFVDDGSTDTTAELVSPYGKVIRTPNRGPGAARNAGLEAATGDYVWFVDADDRIKPPTSPLKGDVVAFGSGYDPDADMLDRQLTCGPWTAKIYRRQFLIENDIRFAECYSGEDGYFSLQVAELFETQTVYPERIYEIVHTPDSLSRGPFDPRWITRWTAIERMAEFIRGHPRDGAKRLERYLVFLSLGLSWSYYLERGKLRFLLPKLPGLLKRMWRAGLLKYLSEFLKTGSPANRAAKLAALVPALIVMPVSRIGDKH